VLVSAGQSLVLADAPARALPLYERAAQIFLREGNVDEFVRSRAMAAGPLYDSARPDESIALLEDTRAIADGRASQPIRDRLLVRLGLAYAFKPDVERGVRCIEAIDPANVNASASLAAEYYYLKARMHALRGERAAWHEAMEAGLARNAERKPLSDDSRIALSNATIEALARCSSRAPTNGARSGWPGRSNPASTSRRRSWRTSSCSRASSSRPASA
jgi:hypothetical protein